MEDQIAVKEIPLCFTKKGDTFERVFKNEQFYIYKRTTSGIDYFEVFRRKIVNCMNFNTHLPTGEQKETYPKDEHFGVWAWCCISLDRAMSYVDNKEVDTFECKSCKCNVPVSFNVKTEGYCYLCDPKITLDDLLSDDQL